MASRTPILSLYHYVPGLNSQRDRLSLPPEPCRGGNPTVSRAASLIQLQSVLTGAIGGATSTTPSIYGHDSPVPNADETKPGKLSSPAVNPTAVHETEPDLKSSLRASPGLVIDVVKDSSDDLPSLKTVADKTKPLPSIPVDPTVVYENKESTLYASAGLVIDVIKESSDAFTPPKPDWKSTLHASAGLVIDMVKESSDAFAPLKAVAGGLSAVLKHYDVRHAHFFKPFMPLTSELANDGEP